MMAVEKSYGPQLVSWSNLKKQIQNEESLLWSTRLKHQIYSNLLISEKIICEERIAVNRNFSPVLMPLGV